MRIQLTSHMVQYEVKCEGVEYYKSMRVDKMQVRREIKIILKGRGCVNHDPRDHVLLVLAFFLPLSFVSAVCEHRKKLF